MNKYERNKLLKAAYQLLDRALDLLNEANDAEQEALENWAENLQESDRYYAASERADNIDSLRWDCESVRDTLEEIING